MMLKFQPILEDHYKVDHSNLKLHKRPEKDLWENSKTGYLLPSLDKMRRGLDEIENTDIEKAA